MIKKIIYNIVILGIMAIIVQSCTNDDILDDPNAKLEFSLDTLTFDTVFTAIGSTTRSFKVYNPNKRTVNISKIQLAGLAGDAFRLNIDGSAGNVLTDVTIPANDSIYIFAEVTVDPNDLNNPYVITDKIRFETNGNQQEVTLEAWGQNANYIGSKGSGRLLSCNFQDIIFDDAKPYVIYGILVVDSCNLVLPEGCRLYIHGGLVNQGNTYSDGIIYIGAKGKLISNGTKDNPVVIRGDRLEPFYDDEVGQWAGILIGQNSKGNRITHTTIRNSIVGIRVDSAADLTIKNSTIHNTNSSNILGVHSTIYAENCVFFSSNGGNNVQLEYGGNYKFNYCTITTMASASGISHSSPVLRMTNVRCFDEFCVSYDEYPLNAIFKNCIIYGTRANEITTFDRTGSGNFNFTLDHCLIKLDQSEADNAVVFDNCNECVINSDPLFVDIDAYDYRPDTLSPVEEKAFFINDNLNNPITIDKNENVRDAITPDIGAYEYQY
jgi:hypothetical protein